MRVLPHKRACRSSLSVRRSGGRGGGEHTPPGCMIVGGEIPEVK